MSSVFHDSIFMDTAATSGSLLESLSLGEAPCFILTVRPLMLPLYFSMKSLMLG